MVPKLSDEAWALLGILHRASHGGPRAPAGFADGYAELRQHGLVLGNAITDEGEAVLSARYLSSNPEFPPKKQPKGHHS